jgi:beta-N-acetylhexosaminidase
VLDLGNTPSRVIGDRGFHEHPEVVADLATQWIWGARDAGMASVGKHFPGHGSVLEDSHLEVPRDQRRFEDLLMLDLIPFQRLIAQGLDAMMPAHVIFEQIDSRPAGFSSFWLQQVLRQRFDFQGVIFSDDLSMAAAAEGGDYPQRARAALAAGCDMVLVCNNPEAAAEVLHELRDYENPASQARMIRMHGRKQAQFITLRNDPRWRKAIALAADAVLGGPESELKLV